MKNAQTNTVPTPVSLIGRVMAYQNQDVINRFLDDFDVSKEEALSLFNDMKRWLYACGQRPTGMNMEISTSIIIIDEMWHAFILHTRDYDQFCKEMFGKFIHHAPYSTSAWETSKQDANYQKNRRIAMTKQLHYLHGLFGDELIQRWYVNYPETYSKESIERLRKDKDYKSQIPTHIENIEGKGFDEKIRAISFRETHLFYCGVNCGPMCNCNSDD